MWKTFLDGLLMLGYWGDVESLPNVAKPQNPSTLLGGKLEGKEIGTVSYLRVR